MCVCVCLCVLVLCNPKATWPTNETSYSNHVRECSQVDNINCTENIKKQHTAQRRTSSTQPTTVRPTDRYTHSLRCTEYKSFSNFHFFSSKQCELELDHSNIRTWCSRGEWVQKTHSNKQQNVFLSYLVSLLSSFFLSGSSSASFCCRNVLYLTYSVRLNQALLP